jgi:hypothetical protein
VGADGLETAPGSVVMSANPLYESAVDPGGVSQHRKPLSI